MYALLDHGRTALTPRRLPRERRPRPRGHLDV